MFGTVSAKNLNHGLRYPKEICKNFNNFPIAEYGKVHAHLTDLIRVNCIIGQLTLLVRYDYIFLDLFFLKALNSRKIFPSTL